jgi:peptidyl-prolyl cis-trans isomerase B (cyclophilin B)
VNRLLAPAALFALLAACLVSTAEGPARPKKADPDPEPAPAKLIVAFKTNKGTIKVELYKKKAPKTVENFVKYVKDKHYDGMTFHRVIPNFMIQGGGFSPGMKEKKTGKPIMNEADNKLSNARGTIAMARTVDPHSATAQFFINVKDNPALDHKNKAGGWGYCVFGKVVAGMDVVDKITGVRTTSKGVHNDVPAEDVVIESARLVAK